MNRLIENLAGSKPEISPRASPQDKHAIVEALNGRPGFSIVALTHEVRNPLTNINLALEMLTRLTNDENQKLYIAIIKRASNRINGLINELARQQEAEGIPAEEHSMHELLDEVLTLAEDRIMLNKIGIKKEYGVNDYRSVLNREKMKIALTNIIVNALDSMEALKGELKVITGLVNSQYRITIEDNGCGISEEDLKHIFKPFFSRKTGGLGIGLAATHDILASNNITMHVHSEKDKGTKFILLFAKSDTLL